MNRVRVVMSLLFQIATFIMGLYFMHQIIVYGHEVQPFVVPLVAYMIGFPIANLIDVARVRTKERNGDA